MIEELVKKGMRDAIIHGREFSYIDIYKEYFIYKDIINTDGSIDKKY